MKHFIPKTLTQKIALVLLPFVALGLFNVYANSRSSDVYAVNPLTVTYDGDSTPDPMFRVFNMLPGDEVEKEFKVKNTGPNATGVEMYASLTSVLKNFDEILEIEIVELPSTVIFQGILEDFLESDEFDLGNFPAGSEKTYRVKVKFPSSAGNEYQNAKVIFDIVWQAKHGKPETELPPECSHLEGKIKHVIKGDERNNHLVGTHWNDLIIGYGGNDHIDGKSGDDCIVGGDKNDKLEGGPGEDTILGGNGNDKLEGESGQDKLYGQAGNDNLFGGSNNDFLDGGADTDFLKGETGTDTCTNGESVHSSCEL